MGKVVSAVSALLMCGLVAAAAATGDNERSWSLGGDGRDPYLVFGNQEMGETTILLICNNRRKTAELSVSDAGKDAKAGQPVTIELASRNGAARFAGKTVRSAGIFGYARRIDFEAVAALLRAPGPVTVTMGETSYTLHDKGRAKALAELVEMCRLK